MDNQIKTQIDRFKSGFPELEVVRPASIGDGILKLTQEEEERFIAFFDRSNQSVEKFVPASGAATRMFQDLLEFQKTGKRSSEVDKFFSAFDRLPLEIKGLEEDEVLEDILGKKAWHQKPKGLLPFHQYEDGYRSAFEEHFYEGLEYALKNGLVKLHFTIAPNHLDQFKEESERLIKKIGKDFEVSFSVQDPNTDSIAVYENEDIVKLPDGEYLKRPAGHGALLGNLGALNSDVIFIKNIDNVVPDRLKDQTIHYKKVLGGVLLHYQEKCFELLNQLRKGNDVVGPAKKLLSEMGMENVPDDELANYLNRPLRVCGMVQNTGEPGGGPFWINQDGKQSLQIIEASQLNSNNESHQEALSGSTHFNPADLVCSIKDLDGNKFSLNMFRDDDMGIITIKDFQGTKIRALELPGLWNGSMANWNTIFIEIPLITFNPVKRITDLLRKEHQPAI